MRHACHRCRRFVVAAARRPAAQESHQHEAGRLGTVKFANSCAADVQPAFARGMALLHSFEFGPAMDAFKTVSRHGSRPAGLRCGRTGLSQWGNPFSAALRPAAAAGGRRGATLERAAAVGAKTPRERDFIAAAAALYDKFETVDQRRAAARLSRCDGAGSRRKYPDDPEASAFYALALAAAADPADKTYVDQLKAGAILEKLWAAQPEHPGFAHYIIHSYDVPALAPRAVAAARRYAKIAPDAPHALHMPSHTFTRLGYWQDSIETNILSAAAARKVNAIGEELHASDYQTYAYLQSGQDAAARRIVESLPEILSRRVRSPASAAPPPAGPFAVAAIPARYALERGAWADAARLEPRTTPFRVRGRDDLVRARARRRAHARRRRPPGRPSTSCRRAVDRTTQAKETYWIEQVTIQKLGRVRLAGARGGTER